MKTRIYVASAVKGLKQYDNISNLSVFFLVYK